jgi:hypothetical protein
MLDHLDTPGGAIAILLLLSVLGVAMTALHVEHGHYVLMTAFGALVALLRGHGGKQDPPASGQAPTTQGAAATPPAPIASTR